MAIFGRKKVYLLIPTPGKVGTWWGLNPHCSGGRRCNHITRISPLAKYPNFGGVTAICRGSMTGKVLTRHLNGKTGIGWNLNTPSWNTAKASYFSTTFGYQSIFSEGFGKLVRVV